MRTRNGTRRETAKKRAAEELLECAQSLKPELAALDRSARRYQKLLSREVSAAEMALLATPAVDLLRSLEIVFNSEIELIVNRGDKVEVFLSDASRQSGQAVGPRRKAKASPARKAGVSR